MCERNPTLSTAADQLSSKLSKVEDNLIQSRGNLLRKIGYLADEVESGDFQPTTQEVAVYNELKEQAETYRQRLTLLGNEVATFNALLRRHNILNVVGEQ